MCICQDISEHTFSQHYINCNGIFILLLGVGEAQFNMDEGVLCVNEADSNVIGKSDSITSLHS